MLHYKSLLKYWPPFVSLSNSDYCIYKCWSWSNLSFEIIFPLAAPTVVEMVLVVSRVWWKRVGDCCTASYCSLCVLILGGAPKRECILPQAEALQQECSKSKAAIPISTESWQVVWQPWWGNFFLYLCRKRLEVRECGFYLDGEKRKRKGNKKKRKKKRHKTRMKSIELGVFYLTLNVS